MRESSLSILILNWKDITNPMAGGGTYYTQRVAEYLAKKGYEITLLCSNYIGGKEKDYINGVNIIRIGNRYTVYIKAPLKFLKNYRNAYDLVIDEINVLPWMTPLYVRNPKIAFIHQTAKEDLFEEMNRSIATLIYSIGKMSFILYRNMTFITVSPSVKQELIANGISKKNIIVIPPGIDVNKYSDGLGKKASFPAVLYLGRLKKYKGVHHLIQAMKYVVAKLPEAKLSIVGDGDYRDNLMKLTTKLRLQDSIRFLGYVSEREKIKMLKKAWVLVLPSVREGFGIVAIEAAVCGTPAIGTNTLGLKDSIIHGKTGFLVPYGNPRILAQRICEVLKNDELRYRLSKSAHKWGKRFGWERTLDEFERVIKQVGGTKL